jgi:predicted Zn finger-like uncharacterized protein
MIATRRVNEFLAALQYFGISAYAYDALFRFAAGMILTCPTCSTRYQADEKNFPPEGRSVRCAKCGNVWHQALPEPVADPNADIFEDGPAASPEAEPNPGIFTQETAAEDTAGPSENREPPPFGHRRGEDRFDDDEPSGRWQLLGARIVIGLGWIGLAALVLATGLAALTYRQTVMTNWPQSASLYATLGFKSDASYLRLVTDPYRKGFEDGQPVLILTGKLVNESTKELPVPALRASLSDAAQRDLYHWTFLPTALTLKPGQSTRFSTRLSSPPAAARHIEIRFAKAGE